MPNETQCESCVWMDTDPVTGEDICTADMDEDERHVTQDNARRPHKGCPWYRYYNEYKSVQRQN